MVAEFSDRETLQKQGLNPAEFRSGRWHVQTPGYLPNVCVGCGSRTGLKDQVDTVSYVTAWVLASLILTPLGLVLSYLLFRKRLRIRYARCDKCEARRRMWRVVTYCSWSAFALSLLVIPASPLVGLPSISPGWFPIVSLIAACIASPRTSLEFRVGQYANGDFELLGSL